MCGIIGYTGHQEAYPLLVAGLEKLEYRGYDRTNDLIFTETQIYKEKKGNDNKMNFYSPKITDVADPRSMNILNFMELKDYYCQISTSFQERLQEDCTNHSQIALQINTSRTTIRRIAYTKNYWMSFETLSELCKIFNIDQHEIILNITFIKTHNSFPLSFEIKNLISPPLFRILGHILGDGGIHVIEKEGKYRAFYTNNRQELLDSFYEDTIRVFNNIKLYRRNRINKVGEVWLPTTAGLLMYNLFDYKNLNKKKRIPKFVFEIDDKILLGAFLQALYDDEGYLYPIKRMIVISQKSRELVEDIRGVVIKIGIRPNQILVHQSKNRTTMYYFSITHKDNFALFNKYIGFIHPIKKEKLKLLMQKYQRG